MSFSFGVPATPATDFEAAAAKAKDDYAAAQADNDYMLTQLASGLADEAVELAVAAVKGSRLGDGTVSASLSGHAVPVGEAGTCTLTVSLSSTITATPAPAAAS